MCITEPLECVEECVSLGNGVCASSFPSWLQRVHDGPAALLLPPSLSVSRESGGADDGEEVVGGEQRSSQPCWFWIHYCCWCWGLQAAAVVLTDQKFTAAVSSR